MAIRTLTSGGSLRSTGGWWTPTGETPHKALNLAPGVFVLFAGVQIVRYDWEFSDDLGGPDSGDVATVLPASR
jgi:hypothetical protein